MVRFPYDEQGRPVVQVELRLPAAVRREKLRSGLSLGREIGWALVDTGADGSAFDTSAAGRAGLRPTGVGRLSRHARDGFYEVPTFDGDLVVNGLKDLRIREAPGLSLGRFGWIAVIGRDFLADMVLVCNGRNRTLSLEPYR